jgi:hypothetical protein
MRKASGILLILLGAIVLAIYAIVMLRLPILAFLPSRFGVGLYVDPVEPPIWAAAAFLAAGTLLLRHRGKSTAPVSRQ